MTHDDQIRAERARQLVEDELLIGALGAIEARHVAALKSAPVANHDALMKSTAGLQAVESLREELRAIIERGTEKPAPRRGIA